MYCSTLGRSSTTDPILLLEERLYDPQQINLYGYCRNAPYTFTDPDGMQISFLKDKKGREDEDSRKAYDDYVAFLKKNPEKYKNELATIEKLTNSDVNYIIVVGAKVTTENAEGNTMPDAKGENILVNITNTADEKFERNGRFAHELEHARQFDDGELAFYGHTVKDGKNTKTVWSPMSYDIYDEVNAFRAQINVSAPVGDTPQLKTLRLERDDTDFATRLRSSGGSYGKLAETRTNVNFMSPPGTLHRPTDKSKFFGRQYRGGK